MAYKVIKAFADKTDNYHVYQPGDTFPRSGKKISKERIAELSGTANSLRTALIEAVAAKKRGGGANAD